MSREPSPAKIGETRSPTTTMHIQALAQALKAEVDASLEFEITGVAPLMEASSQEVTFLANLKYHAQLQTSQAGAVLVAQDFKGQAPMPMLRVAHPYLAFAQAIEIFHAPTQPTPGVHPTVVLGEGVTLGQNVSIGAYTVIGNQVQIGDGVTIHPHCTIYDHVTIGPGTLLHSHVVLREAVCIGERVILQNGVVIGADGYGFVPLADGSFYKIRQAGTVVLEEDVEVQAQTAIDRATLGTTRIGRGTKIDSLVQIGHNCTVGQHSLLCGQVGLAGSTQVGNHVTLAGQVGAAGHLTIGDRVVAAAKTGIHHSLAPDAKVVGAPAIDHKLGIRALAQIKRLPELVRRLTTLEKQVASLNSNKGTPDRKRNTRSLDIQK